MTTRLTSTDASVQHLMSRLHELESRRRMSMMHAKEAESRVALTTEEQSRVARDVEILHEREGTLKQSLQMLSDEQRQLQLRTEASHRTVESAEKEEPLLLEAANAALELSKKKCESWKGEHEALSIVQNKWLQPSLVSQFESTLAEAERELRSLLEEEQSLIAAAAAAQSARVPTTNEIDPSETIRTGEAMLAAKDHKATSEEIDRLKLTIDEFKSQASRRSTIVGREVGELTNKAADLDKWISDSSSAVDELKSNIADMTTALQDRCCPACSCSTAC
ncbi:Hypothetical protein, putative [Bodo saltans]|uniref:Uncharacterized protein n=1 Tax=Bodo saltans TaxID=75058 RepID=A0A0S4ILD4_BODSA|nr:Hypothetical protein, putative [Bodo saltans]|eukprot:CUF23861.1 Hypothetical protein, putative [Bodo saltans]